MDKVVAAVSYEGYVLVITERGNIFKLAVDRQTGEPRIQVLTTIPLPQ